MTRPKTAGTTANDDDGRPGALPGQIEEMASFVEPPLVRESCPHRGIGDGDRNRSGHRKQGEAGEAGWASGRPVYGAFLRWGDWVSKTDGLPTMITHRRTDR